jgi:YidC/Oxa1 family membrane protein insertase
VRKRHKDDPQRQQQEIMELYKREKVNPVAGCLPMLIQIPVFFSLYKVLYVTIEMRQAPFFGWIHDLSAPDPTSILNLFGLLPYHIPAFVPAYLSIGIWPILMGITQFIQTKLNPAPTDPVQAKMFTFMPLIFTFMFATFPAGLVIYYTWNNLLSVTQQYVIMRREGVKVHLFENLKFRRAG